MFSKLARANSKRQRKESSLYFSSMIISIVAFYVILSLQSQDVMIFLKRMESASVENLMAFIPPLYIASLFIIFILVYFATSIQFEERRHEFGVYLTLGMKPGKLFRLLLEEDIRNNLISLLIGLPIAIALTELISLLTSKLVGLGIIGHTFTFSPKAIGMTCLGFLLVKFLAFMILVIKMRKFSVGEFLGEREEEKKTHSKKTYITCLILGLTMMISSYKLGISGKTLEDFIFFYLTLFLGICGTILFFFGLRLVIGYFARKKPEGKLATYNLRQVEEQISERSTLLATCSLLIFAAIGLFASGVTFSSLSNSSEVNPGFEYSFSYESPEGRDKSYYEEAFRERGLDGYFERLSNLRVGFPVEGERLDLENLKKEVDDAEEVHFFDMIDSIYLLPLSDYNEVRKARCGKEISLKNGEAALYSDEQLSIFTKKLDPILKKGPVIGVGDEDFTLKGGLETFHPVADIGINIGLGLVVTDEDFEKLRPNENIYTYVNGKISEDFLKDKGLMNAMLTINEDLDQAGFSYDSYLQTMGRIIFGKVASTYLTLYLGIILMIVANTIIGVQFLLGQRRAGGRYQTLIHLGANYDILKKSANKQINLFFGLPIGIALVNGYFGVKTILMTMSTISYSLDQKLKFIGGTLLVLFVIELFYMRAVKKASNKYLWTMMKPVREE